MDRQGPRAFRMIRRFDVTGVSGTGQVLEGVVFADGQTVVRWCVADKPRSTELFASFADSRLIHIDSHPGNATEVVWAAP